MKIISESGFHFVVKCKCGKLIKHPKYSYRITCDCGNSIDIKSLRNEDGQKEDIR